MNRTVQDSHKLSLYPWVLIISVILFSYSSAQITIPQTGFSTLLTVGKTFNYYKSESNPQLANIGKRGGSNVYDFSGYKFESSGISNVYSAGAIPTLAARFPAKAITFGATVDSIENNPVFLFGTDTLFVIGEATMITPRRFRHIVPYEPMSVFPVTYQATRVYTHTHYDTTFTSSGAVASTNFFSGTDSVTVDGFGTLKILGRQFECLRVKMNHFTFSDKEFLYLTREGLFLDVMMTSSQPDTGSIQPESVMLLVPASVVAVGEHNQLPSKHALEQNYPNPFNPSTTIQFSIPNTSFVSLKVFNVLGAEMATLANENKAPGPYRVTWDANGYPSGVYFYRLMSAGKVFTGKMNLLK